MRRLRYTIITAMLTWATLTQAQTIALRLDSLMLDPLFETTQVGMMVHDLTTDQTLYKRGQRQLLRPASTMKLLTAITALRELGADYRVTTQLYTQGTIADSTFTGNIYCHGSLDPAFGDEDMNILIDSLRLAGINAINGTIVLDRSMKDNLPFGEGWCWDDRNPILTPLLYERADTFAAALLAHLNAAGITTNADIAEGITPTEAQPIASTSHTIGQLLLPMMKKSDNLYAEAVYYQIAAAAGTPYATAAMAKEAEQRLIADLGLEPKDYRLADGSGLSLYNYLSAEVLVRLLRYAWQNPAIYESLYPTLPVAGLDGTLKDRMKGETTTANVWAKTGTLSGISSLAGYALTPEGHVLAFAIINQGVRSVRYGRDFQDRVCEILCAPAASTN